MVESDRGDSEFRPNPRLIATPEDFARSLRVLRGQAGLSLREAAKALEVELKRGSGEAVDSPPFTTLAGWFSGRNLPTPKLVKVVPTLLGVCGESDPVEVKEWLAALERVRRLPGPRPAASVAPFRGLAAYEPEHAEFFCGREALTAELLALMARCRRCGGPVILVGSSGSGKSSLLRAGLIPALTRDGSWHYLLFTPGSSPILELATQLASLTGRSAEAVERDLLEDPRSCGGLIRLALAPRRDSGSTARRVVIVVDQLEELFIACREDEAQLRVFVQALCSAAGPHTDQMAETTAPQSLAVVVMGMRADFYAQAVGVPELLPILQKAQLVVGPMSEDELRRAITEPARKANLVLESGLVEILLRDLAPSGVRRASHAAHEAGALPLLSHALLTTWEQAKGWALTVEHYRATDGIRGSIAKTAEDAFARLATAEQQDIARRLFLRLVWADDDAETRRKVSYAELLDGRGHLDPGNVQEVLDQFILARLVTADGDTIQITHEAVLTAWPRLRGWLEADAAWLRLHRRLIGAARSWQETDRDPDLLYRGGMLQITREQVEDRDHHLELNPLEREFLHASITRHAAEQLRARRSVRRRYQLLALLTVLALAAGGTGAYARQLQVTGRYDRAQALSRLVAGKADRLRGKDVPLAMQLALAAYRIAPTPEARSSLLNSTAVPAATRLRSASGAAESIAMSGNGKLLAAGTEKGPVQLWTLGNDGHALQAGAPLTGPSQAVLAVAFSHDGRTLAAGGNDKRIHLWDTTDPAHPRLLGTLAGPSQAILSIAMSFDGRLLAAGSEGHKVYLWNISDRTHFAAPRVLVGPTQAVRAVAFTPDGRTLAAGSNDSTIRLWNVADPAHPAVLSVLSGPTRQILSIAISPDGRRLAAGTSAEHSVFLWDITNPAHPAPTGPPLAGPASWINTVTFSPDSRTVAAGSSDSLLWLFDVRSRQATGQLPHPNPVTASIYRTDHTLVTLADDGTVRSWSLPGPIISGATDSVFAVSFDTTGHKLGIGPGAGDNTLTVWDPTDIQHPVRAGPALANTPRAGRFSGSGALTPDGRVFAVGGVDGSIQLWDISDPARPARLGAPIRVANDLVESVTISNDGHLLAVNADDGAAHLVDITDPRHPTPLAALRGPNADFIYQSTFNPDGTLLAVASRNHSVNLWDISRPTSPKLLTTLDGFTDAVYSTAFSHNGHILAAGSADHTVQLWDITDPEHPDRLTRSLTGPVSYIYSVVFHPRQDILAVGSTDNTVWLWDLARPRQPVYLATLTGPTQGVLTVAISPDGHTLAAGGLDHTVRLWNIDPAAAAAWICATAGQAITEQEWTQYIPDPDRPYSPPCR
jgi:WD40 repeat protein